MKPGTYNYERITDNTESTVSEQVANDLDFVKKGQKLEYSDAYVNYIGHLEVLKIKMDNQEVQQVQLNELSSQISQEESSFAEFYMTLLATKISENIGAGLVTSSSLPHNLSLKVKADAAIPSIIGRRDEERSLRRHHQRMPREAAQGLLIEY